MITCAIDMFGYDQMIYYVNEAGEKTKIRTNMDTLGEDIGKACQINNSFDIHLWAPQAYAEKKVIPSIYKYFGDTYDLNKINIEVN
jgi:hypothetical protein